MGYSIRSEKWRDTEWRDRKGAVVARELYDHPESDVATVNLIAAPNTPTPPRKWKPSSKPALTRLGLKG